jgi:hypothetical protein
MVRNSNHTSGLRTFVVIQIDVDDVQIPRPGTLGGSSNERRYWTDDRGQRLGVEALGFAFNCGGAALAAVGVAGSSVATAATAGAASPLVYLSAGAAVAGSLQCGVSIGRIFNVLTHDEARDGEHPNDMLDSDNNWALRGLRMTLLAADVIGVLDAAGGAYRALRAFSGRLALTGGNQAARAAAARQLLRAMPPRERAQFLQELYELLRRPLTPDLLRALVQEGKITGMGSVRFGQALQTVLRSRLQSAMSGLRLGVGGTITGGVVGAVTGSSDLSASVVRRVVAHVFQDGARSLTPADGGTRTTSS